MLFYALLSVSWAADPVERHPYIQRVTDDQATICWMTAEPAEGRVLVGTTADDLSRTLVSPEGLLHEVLVTELEAGQPWYYAVEAELDGEWTRILDAQEAYAAPPTGDRGGFRAWVLGDSGNLSEAQLDVARSWRRFLAGEPADLWLHTGDIAYNSAHEHELTEATFNIYPDILVNTPLFPTYGNHDGYASDSYNQIGPWFDAFALPAAGQGGGVPSGHEDFYAFEWANTHFISLNAFDANRDREAEMGAWLKADLHAVDRDRIDWIVVYFHHPSYSKGSHDSDYETELIEMRENINPIMEAGGVDLVLNGHSHTYERSYLLDGAYHTPSDDVGIIDDQRGDPLWGEAYLKAQGIETRSGTVYTVAGHGGASTSFRDIHPLMAVVERENGSVALDIEGDTLKLTNVRADGLLSDRVAILKGTALMLVTPDGGELLLPGEPRTIRWISSGEVSQVRLSYSLDREAWTHIAEVKNSGSYTWTPPDHSGARTWLRIEDVDDPSVVDQSSASFFLGGDLASLAGPDDLWRFYSADPGSSWIDRTFDDTTWGEGEGPFGYGGGEITTLPEGEPTYYLRRQIHLDRQVEAARLSLRVDDGAMVWLNGQQILHWNVESSDHEDYAAVQAPEVEGGEVLLQVLNPGLFQAGDNTLAVLVKPHANDREQLIVDVALQVRLGEVFPAADGVEGEVDQEDPDYTPSASEDTEAEPDTEAPVDPDPAIDEGEPAYSPEPVCSCGASAMPASFLVILGLLSLMSRRRRARRG